MAKNPFPRQNSTAPATVPGQPPRFTPGATSPLDQTARNFAPRIPVQSAQEQRRAENLSAAIAAGNAAPRFGDPMTPPPFTPTTAAPVNANTGPKAGGSKTK